MTTEATAAACAICSVVEGMLDCGGIDAEDVGEAYADGFADGVVALVTGVRRPLCEAHERALEAALAEHNIIIGHPARGARAVAKE